MTISKGNQEAKNASVDNEELEKVKVMQPSNDHVKDVFDIVKSDSTFKDVGGLDDLKEELKLKIIYPFEKQELFAKYGKSAGGGLLLYGPPGCGKTLIAKACAGEIKFNFINVSINDIKDMWHGITEKNIDALFKFARKNKPAVLFIDEIDALCSTRDSGHKHESTITNQFLMELDGIKTKNEDILIVGATNAPWAIDHAFLRQGRFDKAIFVHPPDSKARIEILKIMLKGKPIEKIDYTKLAELTAGFSGADLKNLVETTVDNILKECIKSGSDDIINVTTDLLIKNIENIVPSTKKWFNQVNNYIEFSNDDGFYDPVKRFMDAPKEKTDLSYFG